MNEPDWPHIHDDWHDAAKILAAALPENPFSATAVRLIALACVESLVTSLTDDLIPRLAALEEDGPPRPNPDSPPRV